MKIIKIDKNNQVNGDGLRCVVWAAGCAHKCKGCHNPESWDFNCGHEITTEEIGILYQQLSSAEISGITVSGGDPFYQPSELEELCAFVQLHFPQKDVWCYTGFTFEEILQDEEKKSVLWAIDVLIDGEYKQELNPGNGKILWRGSSNQRIIDVQESLRTETIVLKYK